jgi:multiple sugar transport system ATP-binding protein
VAQIHIQNVTKTFGKFDAVQDLDLMIEDGTFVALLGPSGCGKSTTMNMLSGLLEPTKGDILFDGKVVNGLKPGDRNIGFVFQNYAIFTHMSAFDNIAFGLKIRKRPKEEIEQEVTQVAELLGIADMLDRRTTELSVNDLQKVAIGRSMITKPGIFLLDEPFSNLDAGFRSYMRAELKKLQRELDQTMIYVTHDQVEAMSMAERIAIMDKGRLQQYGTPDEVYNQPANRFVAGFVGSTMMNFLPAALDHTGDDLVLTMPVEGARPVTVHPRSAEDGDDAFTMGIRPEHIELVDPGSDAAWLRGSVTLVEALGPRNIVHLNSDRHVLRVVVPPTVRPRVGDSVGLELDPRRVHVFSDASGRALV